MSGTRSDWRVSHGHTTVKIWRGSHFTNSGPKLYKRSQKDTWISGDESMGTTIVSCPRLSRMRLYISMSFDIDLPMLQSHFTTNYFMFIGNEDTPTCAETDLSKRSNNQIWPP